jgi:hypothetical protein
MSYMNEQELDRAIRDATKRAVIDGEFRKKAVADGAAALAAVSSKAVPPGLTVQFVDNHGKNTKTIVLPEPIVETEQLSEADLEAVAGGVAIEECGQSCAGQSCITT